MSKADLLKLLRDSLFELLLGLVMLGLELMEKHDCQEFVGGIVSYCAKP